MTNVRYRSACVAALLLSLSAGSYSQSGAGSPDLVISQVYGGGGNSGATYTHDFIELYNRGTAPISLDGWSVQYASSAGNFGTTATLLTPLTGTIQPGRYLLIQEAQGSGGTVPLPTPDVIDPTPIAMSGTGAKVALVTSTTALACGSSTTACTPSQMATIRDLVGWGSGASLFEGSAPAPGTGNTTAAIRKGGGQVDTDNNSADFTSAAPTPRNSGSVIAMSINDVTIAEGDASNAVATFTVSLSSPAVVPVTFTVETLDGTAAAGSDYVSQPAQIRTIAIGERSATIDVTILADLVIEADETFTLLLTNVSGVAVADDRGVGTIQNDDLPSYAIHELQGADAASPHAGERVATNGIVTGLKANGFFIQTPDAELDTSAETSEGIFVFTGLAPTVAIGDQVRVTGQVVEFRRASDALAGTLTEIGGTVQATVLSSGNALPAPIDAATFDFSALDRATQFERYESMLVRAASLTVVAPTNRFGEFFGVLAGRPRPFREPGVDVNDVVPPGAPLSLPRFDGNPERIMVDSDESLGAGGLRRAALMLSTGAVVAPVEGPLDYAFDAYRISMAGDPVVIPGMSVTAAPTPAADELTVAALNLLNFNPPNPNNAAQVAAFAARLQKASVVLRTALNTPDILGLIEVGDLNALSQLAARVNADAGTSYQAFLVEGIDNGPANDQDVGYLVNTARVSIDAEPAPYGKGETFTFCGDSDILFDRPPFVLRASFQGIPVTVVLNHLKSLIEVNSNAPYVSNSGPCDGTVGDRNRLKRRLGAERLADLLQDLQHESLVVLGDMNAFEFNDGYVDVMGTVAGAPAAADQVVAPSDDRWSHSLVNLVTTLPAERRYSYVFDGSAQVLDHVLVNARMLARLTRFAYARINADFPEASAADPVVPDRFSDHDGPVAYFAAAANLATTTDVPGLVTAGSAFTYQATVTNAGPDAAQSVVITSMLPGNAQYGSVFAPEGWMCAVAGGQLRCEASTLAAGATARFVVSMAAACAVAEGVTFSASTTAASPTERELTTDDNPSTDTGSFTNPAPVIGGAAVDPSVLWPPNGQLRSVRVFYSVTDNCGPVEKELSVRSTDAGRNQGHGESDWVVVSADTVLLRAERSGEAKDGRVYTITITATDSVQNVTTEEVQVRVPHDR